MNVSTLFKQRGVTTIEYALLAAGIAAVIAVVVSGDGSSFTQLLDGLFNGIQEKIQNTDSAE